MRFIVSSRTALRMLWRSCLLAGSSSNELTAYDLFLLQSFGSHPLVLVFGHIVEDLPMRQVLLVVVLLLE